MRELAEEMLAAVGRMTVAATDLEHLLAWDRRGSGRGDAAAVFAQPGQPLRAARGSVRFAPPAYRDEFIEMVEAAGTQLAQGQAVLRAMWCESGHADTAMFDDIAARLLRCRDALQTLVQAHLSGPGR